MPTFHRGCRHTWVGGKLKQQSAKLIAWWLPLRQRQCGQCLGVLDEVTKFYQISYASFLKFNSKNLILTRQTLVLNPRFLLLSARWFFRKTLIENLKPTFTLMPTSPGFKVASSGWLSPILADFSVGAWAHTLLSLSQSSCRGLTLEVSILEFVRVALTLIFASFLVGLQALTLNVLTMLPFSMQHFSQVCKRP